MKKWGKFVPYFIVLAFCIINVGIVGPNRENKVRLPFFNWCLFCSADAPIIKYYEVQIKKRNEPLLILSNRNNRNQRSALLVNNIIAMHAQSQLTKKNLRDFLKKENANVSLYEITCDVHQWFMKNDCGPTKRLGAYEI